MPKQVTPKGAMQQKTDVQDADKTTSFKSGITGNQPDERTGPKNVFLAGLPGSGKSALAEAAAEKLGLQYLDLVEPLEKGGIEAVERNVIEIAQGSGGVFAALPAKALSSEIIREHVTASGALVYLMADMPLLIARFEDDPASAKREGVEKEEDLRVQFARFEPVALGSAKAIVRAENAPEEVVADLVDKLQVMAGHMSYDVNVDVNW